MSASLIGHFVEAPAPTGEHVLQTIIARLMKLLTGVACWCRTCARPGSEGEAKARQPLCADIDGFSLHAAVRCDARDRKRLEQLCRYITRPALSDERVQLNAAGQVELKLRTQFQ